MSSIAISTLVCVCFIGAFQISEIASEGCGKEKKPCTDHSDCQPGVTACLKKSKDPFTKCYPCRCRDPNHCHMVNDKETCICGHTSTGDHCECPIYIESDCYTYTQKDQDQISSSSVSEKEQCESYPFHAYTAGNNEAYIGCDDCHCCKWKGCYDGNPINYNGTWSRTENGYRCQRFDSQSPHQHSYNVPEEFPQDASVSDAHNYCRNPDNDVAPWCFTEDPGVEWEFCGIPAC